MYNYHFRLTPVKVEEFIRYCNLRRKHSIIDTLEFDKTLEDINKKGEQPISFLIARQNWSKNQNQVSNYKQSLCKSHKRTYLVNKISTRCLKISWKTYFLNEYQLSQQRRKSHYFTLSFLLGHVPYINHVFQKGIYWHIGTIKQVENEIITFICTVGELKDWTKRHLLSKTTQIQAVWAGGKGESSHL